MRELDDTDRRILRVMQEDAALPVAEVAARAGLSTSPCWRRIERMTAEGVILGRRVDVDFRKLGYEVVVSLRVRLDKTARSAFDEFIAAAREVPEVVVIETLLGRVDVRLEVVARSLDHYHDLMRERIADLPHIAELEALLLVSEIKNDPWLAI